MRSFFVIFTLFFLTGCVAKKEASDPKETPVPHISCPEGGDCTFEVIRDSELRLNFDKLGQLNPEVVEGEKIVVRYHFQKKEVPGTADSSHSEYLYLEFGPDEEQLILRDRELEQVKMVYGRICFCRGAMGYFRVSKGRLFLFVKDNELQIRCSFEVDKVPQIINEIDENIKF